jgi:raffinose/stachyose/melibiose transport system substrate-binding protein
MRKLLSVIIVVLMFLLSACTGKETQQSSSVSEDKKVLEFWYIDPGEKEKVYLEAVKRFEQKHSDVQVKTLRISNDAYKQKLSVALSGGNPPDVFHSWGGGWLKEFADSGKVLELNGKIDQNKFNKLALDNATFNGKIYGAPLGLSVTLFFYNREIFGKYDLKPPKTYEELLNVIDVLKRNKIIPIALANQTKWPGAYYLMYFADRLEGPELFDSAFKRTGRGFDDPGYIKAGEYIQDLVKHGAFNEGFNGIPYDAGQGRQLLYSGQAAMMLMSTSIINNIRQEAPNFEKKVDIFPFPTVPGGKGDPSNLSGATGPVWSASATTKYPDLAIDLINELTSLETAKAYADRTGSLAALKDVDSSDSFMKKISKYVNNAKDIHMPYDQTLPPELAELHKDTTQALFGLTMTPEEAAKKMEEKAKEILKK